MRRASLAALSALATTAIVVFAGIAHADPPTSDDSAAARRQKFMEEGDKQSITPPDQSASADAAPPPSQTPEQVWLASLKPIPEGGWQFLMTSDQADHEDALFVSSHNMMIRGRLVTAWFRWEYMAAQTYLNQFYQSAVVREEIDCDSAATRDLAITSYSDSNLGGSTILSQVFDAKVVAWAPAIPGTMGEFMVRWACARVRTHQR